ncbi:MAG: helix-turn-helix domain-containing protein [Bacteroidales bacterium]|nr:helix-turn-helix domain-containing protein [Bacteroidales bacterium]
MNEYHIGEEINKEMRRQGMKPADFARALRRERQTVYDIFKKRHIATDTLADICRILNRDFFKDLSIANFNPLDIDEDEDSDLTEAVSALMPENELHAFPNNYILDEVVEEFLLSDREKPLVIFYTPQLIENRKTSLQSRVERQVLRLMGNDDHDHCCEFRPYATGDSNISVSECKGKLTSLLLHDTNYTKAMRLATQMAKHPGRNTILYIPVANGSNEIRRGRTGGLVYEDIAEELFEAWKEAAHFVYAPALLPRLTRELYRAYRRTGTIDCLIERLSKGDDVSMPLYDLIFGHDILEVEEVKEADSTGLARIRVYYPDTDKMPEKLKTLMHENGVNDNPRLSMWLDVRNGYLIDFQYNKRTQPQ